MADAIIVPTQIALNADTLPDGDLKRIPTKGEIALWNTGGGGGLPEGTTLEEIPDGITRLAISVVDRQKLDAYAENDGKTGDAHVGNLSNPHQVTAAQVGAPTTEAFDELDAALVTAETAISGLSDRMDTAEGTLSDHTDSLGDLNTRLDNLEGTANSQWVSSQIMVGNGQSHANLGSGPTVWNTCKTPKVSLWRATRMYLWSVVNTADAVSSVLRAQYTTDLSEGTSSGWTDFSGSDIALGTTAVTGRAGSIIDVPAGAKTQEFVQIRVVGIGGNGSGTPIISWPVIVRELSAIGSPGAGGGSVDSWNGRTGTVNPATNDYSYDQIAETATGKKFTATLKSKLDAIEAGAQVNTVASVHGRTGAVVKAAGDYATADLTVSTDKNFVTDAEKTRIGSAKLPDDTIAALSGKASTDDGITSTERSKLVNVPSDTNASLALKAPLASPTFTGSPTAPSPSTGDNSTAIATTAFVKNQGYLSSIPAHTHVDADSPGLNSRMTTAEAQIAALSGGGSITKATMVITDTTPVNLVDVDLIFIEHTTNAFVRIPAALSKKPHTLVFLGNPNTVNVAGATGSGQTVKGAVSSGLAFTSGTDAAAVTRTLVPDPDTTNFPNHWRIF